MRLAMWLFFLICLRDINISHALTLKHVVGCAGGTFLSQYRGNRIVTEVLLRLKPKMVFKMFKYRLGTVFNGFNSIVGWFKFECFFNSDQIQLRVCLTWPRRSLPVILDTWLEELDLLYLLKHNDTFYRHLLKPHTKEDFGSKFTKVIMSHSYKDIFLNTVSSLHSQHS